MPKYTVDVDLHDHHNPYNTARLGDLIRRLGLYPSAPEGQDTVWHPRPITYIGISVLNEDELTTAVGRAAASLQLRAHVVVVRVLPSP